MIRKAKISLLCTLLSLFSGYLAAQSLTVTGGTTFRVEASTTVSVTGDVTIESGGNVDNSGTIELTGDWTNDGNGLINGSTGEVLLDGSSSQAIAGSSATTFHDLTIDNSAGVEVTASSVTVDGTLSLTNGLVDARTASSIVVIGSSGSVSLGSGWVVGALSKPVSTGSPSVTYEVGNFSNYTPATLDFSGVTTSGDVTTEVVDGEHPQLSSEGCLDETKRVDQYWSVSNSGVDPLSYDATFEYTSGELFGSPTPADFAAGLYNSGWTRPSLSGTPTGTSTSVTGVSGDGDFAIAEAPLPASAGSVTGLSTVCVGSSGVSYSVPSIAGATSYDWSYSGTGVTFSGSTSSVTANFSLSATSGSITVTGVNACGSGGTSGGHAVTVNVCGAEPSNGPRSGATALGSYNLGTCLATSGDLTLAQASPEANSAVITGEDLWYRFIAYEPGIRIQLNTTTFDGVIELQNSGGTTLESENAVSGIGTEILNHYNAGSPLVTGATYYIAVRNYNSAGGTGAFSICLQRLADSGCASGVGPYNSCNTFKAQATFADSYTIDFTNTTTSATTSVTLAGTTVTSLGALVPGYNYTVDVACTFNLVNGAGTPEIITIDEPNSCTITMSPHADVDLRAVDQCPPTGSVRPRNAIIGANTWLCGAYRYEWEFTPVSPSGLPFTALGPLTNRYIALSGVPLINYSTTYDVRVRPLFNSGLVAGDWGPDYQCLQIAGPGGMVEEPIAAIEDHGTKMLSTGEELATSLYPNPSNGQMVNLNITGVTGNQVSVRILDGTGRMVYSDRYTVDGSLNKVIMFERPLSSGLYMMEMTVDGQVITERFVVSK